MLREGRLLLARVSLALALALAATLTPALALALALSLSVAHPMYRPYQLCDKRVTGALPRQHRAVICIALQDSGGSIIAVAPFYVACPKKTVKKKAGGGGGGSAVKKASGANAKVVTPRHWGVPRLGWVASGSKLGAQMREEKDAVSLVRMTRIFTATTYDGALLLADLRAVRRYPNHTNPDHTNPSPTNPNHTNPNLLTLALPTLTLLTLTLLTLTLLTLTLLTVNLPLVADFRQVRPDLVASAEAVDKTLANSCWCRRSCWRRTPDGKDGWWYLEGCGVADWLSRG